MGRRLRAASRVVSSLCARRSAERAVLNHDCRVGAITDYITAGRARKIIIMQGAGVSCSAGIPDFRTPGSGLYDNLQAYKLPTPESMFDLDYFRYNPRPFYHLAKVMYPGNFAPTPAHFFTRLLEERGLLLRCFTQNIDTLERVAGVSPERLVAAHGSFGTARCMRCGGEHPPDWVREEIFADRIPRCQHHCRGEETAVVKPDIVFFGENLPRRFVECMRSDMSEADLLIVMGTSLSVHPFAGLMNEVRADIPRILINQELVGLRDYTGGHDGFRFGESDNYRDVALKTTCDEGVAELCERLGWMAELDRLIQKGFKRTPGMNAASQLADWKRIRCDRGSRQLTPAMVDTQWRREEAAPLLPPLGE